jgi:uncharacterized membrane protein YkoI
VDAELPPGALGQETGTMNLRLNKKLAVTGAVAAVLVGVGGGASIAATDTPPASPSSGTDDDSDEGPGGEQEESPAFTGSVPAPAETEQSENDASALQGLATTSQVDAEAAALAAVPGTVARTELEDDEGFVVYQVQVDASDGTSVEVTVDAGNGTVLAQSGSDDGDAAEGSDD